MNKRNYEHVISRREPCGKPADEYEVWGESFSCRQVLCEYHAAKAKGEGFRLVKLVQA